MASYVLDTHACIFALAAPAKLGRRARRVLTQAGERGERVWIPAATVAEIVLLEELGRTDVGLRALKEAFELAPNWRYLPLDLEQLTMFADLRSIRDPFDRLVVAAARQAGAKLVSKDAALAEVTSVDVVWS